MEEKKKQCQMEVSLYSQALEHLRQHWTCEILQIWLVDQQSDHCCKASHWSSRSVKRDVRPPSKISRRAVVRSPLACSTATQNKCKAWLKRPHAFPLTADAEPWTSNYPFLDGSSSISEPAATHEAKRTSVILNISAVIYLLGYSHCF